MKQKLRVIFLVNSLAMGGSERVITEYASQLSSVALVKIVLLRNVNDFKVSVPVISLSSLEGKYAYFLIWPLLLRRLTRLIKKEQPDVIVSFLEYSNMLNILSCRHARRTKPWLMTRTVISVRANPSFVYQSGMYGFLVSRLIKRYYHNADLVITNSMLSKKDLSTNFKVEDKKIKVVYNPINTRMIRKMSMEKLAPEHEILFSGRKKVVVSVGRLTYLKGQEHLIKVFSMLKKDLKQAKLVLVGGGELMNRLQSKASSLGIANDVHFVGEQKNPFKFIARSDVFAFTSLYEGFPNAIIEALACQTPVVSVDCRSGPRELLAPATSPAAEAKKIEIAEYGILVPAFGYSKNPGDVRRKQLILKEAILKVINDKGLQKKYVAGGTKRVGQLDTRRMSNAFYKTITEGLT